MSSNQGKKIRKKILLDAYISCCFFQEFWQKITCFYNKLYMSLLQPASVTDGIHKLLWYRFIKKGIESCNKRDLNRYSLVSRYK